MTFRVGPFRFCVDAVEAEAILEAPKINSVPMAPKSIAGVFSYRGRVVVVVSLHRKFGLPDPEQRLSGQIILARINNELKGFWVNEVLDILENTELKWQPFPSLDSFRICSHTIIKDDTIFFHTDFKSLFAAPDSEEFGSLLASLAGSFQNSGSAEHISKQKTPSKPEAPTAEIKDRIDTQRHSQPGEAIEPAINSREKEKKESASNQSSFTQPESAATNATGEKKPIGTPNHPKRTGKIPGRNTTGVESGTGISWSSGNLRRPGTAGGPKSRRHAATAQSIAPRRIPQPIRRDKYMRPEKSDFGWQKLAAGLLFLMVTVAVSAWFWHQSRSSPDR